MQANVEKPGKTVSKQSWPRITKRSKHMMDSGLIDEKPRVTLIQRLDGSVFLIGPKGKKIEFEIGAPLQEIQAKVAKLGWVVGVKHLQRERIEDHRSF